MKPKRQRPVKVPVSYVAQGQEVSERVFALVETVSRASKLRTFGSLDADQLLADAEALREQIDRLNRNASDAFIEAMAEPSRMLDSTIEVLRPVVEAWHELQAANKRVAETGERVRRLARERARTERREEEERRATSEAATQARLCVECRKRERHFGEHCKRCANTLGLRPVGKVT